MRFLSSAANFSGNCSLMASGARFLAFEWTGVPSAIRYDIIVNGQQVGYTTPSGNITVAVSGCRYTYQLWAVLPGYNGLLTTNRIQCIGSTCKRHLFEFNSITSSLSNRLKPFKSLDVVKHRTNSVWSWWQQSVGCLVKVSHLLEIRLFWSQQLNSCSFSRSFGTTDMSTLARLRTTGLPAT